MKTFDFEFNGEKVTVTEEEVRTYYPYKVDYRDMDAYAALRTARTKYAYLTGRMLTPDMVRHLTTRRLRFKAGEKFNFNITGDYYYTWNVTIEVLDVKDYKFWVKAISLDSIDTNARRFNTMEKALLYCLNDFNENSNIRDKYVSIEEYLEKMGAKARAEGEKEYREMISIRKKEEKK